MRQHFLKFKAESSSSNPSLEFRIQSSESKRLEINEQGLDLPAAKAGRERFTTTEISFSQSETYSTSLSSSSSSSKETDTMSLGDVYFNIDFRLLYL